MTPEDVQQVMQTVREKFGPESPNPDTCQLVEEMLVDGIATLIIEHGGGGALSRYIAQQFVRTIDGGWVVQVDINALVADHEWRMKRARAAVANQT